MLGYWKHLERSWREHDHFFSIALATAAFVIFLLYPPVQRYLLHSARSYAIYMILMGILVGGYVYIIERLIS